LSDGGSYDGIPHPAMGEKAVVARLQEEIANLTTVTPRLLEQSADGNISESTRAALQAYFTDQINGLKNSLALAQDGSRRQALIQQMQREMEAERNAHVNHP
jgi:hypothetical protein